MAKEHLPSFASPPVSEVALAAQFEPISGLKAAHFGQLWARAKKRFPVVEEHQALGAKIERRGQSARPSRPKIQVVESAPSPRHWFVSADRRTLIQAQRDRFVRNWRRIEATDVYPRYAQSLKQEFASELLVFCEFLAAEGFAAPVFNQAEVTYVNRIATDQLDGRGAHEGLSVLRPLTQVPYEAEAFSFKYHKQIRVDEEFSGRLYVEAECALSEEQGTNGLVLTLTARGAPIGNPDSIDSVLSFLDVGRAEIVSTFAAITTPELHGRWGLEGSNG